LRRRAIKYPPSCENEPETVRLFACVIVPVYVLSIVRQLTVPANDASIVEALVLVELKSTMSVLNGAVFPVQLIASDQLSVLPPPSHVFVPFVAKNASIVCMAEIVLNV